MLVTGLASAILSFISIRVVLHFIPVAVLKNMLRSSTGWEDAIKIMDAFNHLKQAETLLDDQPEMMKIEVWKELAFAYAYIEWDMKQALANWSKIKPSPDGFPSAFGYLFWAALSRAQGESAEQIHEWVAKGLAELPATLTRSEDRLRYQLLTSLTQQKIVLSVP
ncbi:hypothetical protein EXU85_02790 [Spirosoma sp. KCTC 42546]|uniref:hypothetical protein n=1 Tax=Spirosoma sp. KCTC 42546 TaxID=2520506 RepID=UPI00115BA301|nr:hypothetical protein [Spirosoma sp. KCTC 42546]QDK77577.1 hypothetical protein EXU85_02790 [Spirosoma sp. KCTC 42546]